MVDANNQFTRPEQTESAADQEYDEINLENPTAADIAKYIKGFRTVLCKLKDYIDPLNELPFCFADKEIMSFEEADEIERLKPNTTREIVAKINECLKKNSKNSITILKALIENDQLHIAKFIVSSGMNTRSPDRVLTKEEKDAIDRNMFYLEKLVNAHADDFLALLVGEKCITSNHKEWIINWRTGNKGVYQLFEIIKRRSLKHFTDFKICLKGTGQQQIVEVLRKGGVVEVTTYLKGIENRTDLDTIEKGIIDKLSGNLGNKNEIQLNEEQQCFIDELIDLLNKQENRIKFVGSFRTNSIALYFQCETNDSQEWLNDFCQKDDMKMELKTFYQTLQPELKNFTNFDLDVNMTNSSRIHLILSCIEQALKNKNVSNLAKFMAKCESESRSAEEVSPKLKTGAMKSPVSRDACNFFRFSGSSVEAEVCHQLVVERINADDIMTALKLCCIGHHKKLGRKIRDAISLTPDPQTLGDTFEQMNKRALYEEEKNKFLSVCDEWYTALEPQGLMNFVHRDLLWIWIRKRQYANTEDIVVFQMKKMLREEEKAKKRIDEEWRRKQEEKQTRNKRNRKK